MDPAILSQFPALSALILVVILARAFRRRIAAEELRYERLVAEMERLMDERVQRELLTPRSRQVEPSPTESQEEPAPLPVARVVRGAQPSVRERPPDPAGRR